MTSEEELLRRLLTDPSGFVSLNPRDEHDDYWLTVDVCTPVTAEQAALVRRFFEESQ